MTDRIARRLAVRGRVQGVFYRDSCRREAELLGVAGAVWNDADGSVGVEVEGTPQAVDTLIDWCRTGPPHAVVTAVDVATIEPTGRSRFRILPRAPFA